MATASQFAKKFHSIGACPEGRDWIMAGNHSDFRATWKICPAGEFLAWVATRLLGVEGTRAAVACAKAAAKLYEAREPLLVTTLALCDQIVEGRAPRPVEPALKQLQTLAYDASAGALGNTQGTGEALLSASYAAYAVAFAAMAAQAKDGEEKKRMIAKAAQHSSDAVVHAWEALPGRNQGLVQLVRDSVREEALVRAWTLVPDAK
jgi:hypothetical protein